MVDRDDDKEHDKGFRIVDRRHFTAEGEARPDVPDEAPVSLPSPAAPEPAARGSGVTN